MSLEKLAEYARLEQRGIAAADAVIILLPAGRGTHIELGLALAQGKRVFLCAADEQEFDLQNTVNFYQLPCICRMAGTAEENARRILAIQ